MHIVIYDKILLSRLINIFFTNDVFSIHKKPNGADYKLKRTNVTLTWQVVLFSIIDDFKSIKHT